ncbi:ABC transporter permease [Mucilaginibacter robiniae]|uniref:ABC transporter permease n=1 Tax=Mucilaginibacter robiniae TaxID=2728022 RepID=A0A7L5E7B0_9SPHI|nr:ABC transporter permease [Mucilaginibacter robiniae]QJD96743.1 ABC transporter permease [Mucilaginibacter robiniae]
MTTIPKTSTALAALIRADFATLKSNRRSAMLSLLVPVIILISWKSLIDKMGGAYALSSAITFGLMAIGLMGYAITISRDRDKGVFQRLRVAPVPRWTIMVSRLIIQLAMIILLTLVVFYVGYSFDKITLSPLGYVLTLFTAIVGGAVYLSLGQLMVGLIKNPETVNATTRIVYSAFILVGMFGESGLLGEQTKHLVQWSPYGSVKLMLAASMNPAQWTSDTTFALLASVAYIVVFAAIGIQKFKWNTK